MDEEKRNGEASVSEADSGEEEQNHESRVCIVGLGQTGRELLYRLARHTAVRGLDIDPKKLDLARSRLPEDTPCLVNKDGTSRITWDELGLHPDDVVVAVTRRDEVNLEACRVAKKHFGVKRLLGLSHSTGKAEDYAKFGIETVSRANVMASFLESRVLRDRRPALNVGLGQGEIIEVPILQGSPVVGRPLSTFHARPWLVGAIYRKDKLIVPHGRTVIREGDRVVLIGEPHILSGIADFFKIGEPEFPLQYGPRIGVLPGKKKGESYERTVSESNYLAQHTKATSMVLLSVPGMPEPDVEMADQVCGGTELSCEPAFLPDEGDKSWPRTLQAHDFGCLVMGLGKMGFLKRVGIRRSFLRHVLEESEFPVLVSRGTHPYKRILVSVGGESNSLGVAELAINLARLFGSRLDAVTVTEPVFHAGEEAVADQKAVLDRVYELSTLYRLAINIKYREGNPIKEVVEQTGEYNLVVMGYKQGAPRFPPGLDLALETMARIKCSIMLIPFKAET